MSRTPFRRLLMPSGLSSSGFKLLPQIPPSQVQPGKGKRRDTGTGRLCCQIPESCWITEQKVTVAARLARGLTRSRALCASVLLPAAKCMALASAGQRVSLSRQHISSMHNPEVPGTSVFCASPCLGCHSHSMEGSSMVQLKDALAALSLASSRLPRQQSCKQSGTKEHCFSAESITPPQGAHSSALECFQQAPWEGARNAPATPPSKLPLCLESGWGRAAKLQLLPVQAGSFQQCKPTQMDLEQLSGVLWLGSLIPQSPWMHRCPYWS